MDGAKQEEKEKDAQEKKERAQLKKLFYDPERGGLGGWNRLYLAAKKEGIKVTQAEVKKFVKDQEVAQLHKPVLKPPTHLPFTSPNPNYILQADLMFMDPDYKQLNGGHWIILCVIDIFTRFVWVRPLKTKEAAPVLAAFSDIIDHSLDRFGGEKEEKERFPVVVCQFDGGSEFINAKMKKYCADHDIKQEFHDPGDHQANSLVERFNQTLRQNLERNLTAKKTKSWAPLLQAVVRGYNNSYHSGIKCEPARAHEQRNSDNIEIARTRQTDTALEKIATFVVEQSVRVVRNRVAFQKGAIARWGVTVHKVEEVKGNKYLVNGKWYRPEELQDAATVENESESEEESEAGDSEEEQEKVEERARELKAKGRVNRRLNKEGLPEKEREANVKKNLRPRNVPAANLLQNQYGQRINY